MKVLEFVENQDKEFIKRLKEITGDYLYHAEIDKLAGDKLI